MVTLTNNITSIPSVSDVSVGGVSLINNGLYNSSLTQKEADYLVIRSLSQPTDSVLQFPEDGLCSFYFTVDKNIVLHSVSPTVVYMETDDVSLALGIYSEIGTLLGTSFFSGENKPFLTHEIIEMQVGDIMLKEGRYIALFSASGYAAGIDVVYPYENEAGLFTNDLSLVNSATLPLSLDFSKFRITQRPKILASLNYQEYTLDNKTPKPSTWSSIQVPWTSTLGSWASYVDETNIYNV